MKVLTIAATDVRRLVRWRANIFFLFILPMLIILLIGAAFGGSDRARIGVVGGQNGPLARRFVDDLAARPSTELHRYQSRTSLEQAVAHGRVDAGLTLPTNYDRSLRLGKQLRLSYFARPDSVAQQLKATVQSVAAQESAPLAAAQLLARGKQTTFARALAKTKTAAAATPPVQVLLTAPDGSPYTNTMGRFASGASTQLLLFIFLNSLNGAIWMIETRRLGIARRILSTPTSTRTLVAGQVLGRFAIALTQALIIILGSLLFFGVNWGDPLATGAVVVSFCLVGTGAGVLLGSLIASEQRAGPVALLLGLGLAALGGSMAPLEVFPTTARRLAHLTPHAWGNDAFSKLLNHGAHLAAVLPQIGILLTFAAVALTLAIWQLQRSLTR